MNIALVFPPKLHKGHTGLPNIMDKGEISKVPPLGLMYLAGFLQEHTSHDVHILECQIDDLSYEEIKKRLEDFSPDVVGIYSSISLIYDAVQVARLAKEANPDVHVCLGGPHLDAYPVETLGIPYVDSVVIGEGERSFTELVACLDKTRPLDNVEGIFFKRNGSIVKNKPRGSEKDLNSIPFPARNLIDNNKYYYSVDTAVTSTSMMTTRGCPAQCIYCAKMSTAYRKRSPKDVVDEMEDVAKLGISHINMWDDTFNIDKKRVIQICDEILERNLDISWTIRSRIPQVDRRQLEKLKEAGCNRIVYGIEAGTDRINNGILKRGIKIENAIECFQLTKEVGIPMAANFLIGAPEETREEIMETIRLAIKLDPEFAQFSILTPYPNSPFYTMALQEGVFSSDYLREYAKNPTEDLAFKVWDKVLAEEELRGLLEHAYKSFYFRPKYMVRSLLQIRSPKEFYRKFMAGVSIFKDKYD